MPARRSPRGARGARASPWAPPSSPSRRARRPWLAPLPQTAGDPRKSSSSPSDPTFKHSVRVSKSMTVPVSPHRVGVFSGLLFRAHG